MAQTLNEIRALLAAAGLRPKKRFGQNFLHDGNQMERILGAASVGVGDVVLEVGPGTGALTERLVEAGAQVVAVEIDTDMAEILSDRLGGAGDRVRLVVGDVMSGKRALAGAVVEALEGRRFKLVANLPYNTASPLLATLAADYEGMEMGVVMVQREVADRLTAEAGTKAYGSLTVMVRAYVDVERLFTLSPACFWPRPEVDSAVVRLVRRGDRPGVSGACLSALVQGLFSARRKQLGGILRRDKALPDWLDPRTRPEALTVEQFVALAEQGYQQR